jgi:hypothetical protein
MTDANNYTSTSSLTIPAETTQSGANLEICWDTLTKDILCHDVNAAADIDNVAFLQIPRHSRTVIQDKLAKGTLSQNEVVYNEFRTNGTSTCAMLGSFMYNNPVVPATDYVTTTDKNYMLLFSTGTTPGTGAKIMMFLDPTASSTTTKVSAPASGCEILDFSADLHTPTPLSIPMTGDWVVDWSSITKDSMGNRVNFKLLDRVIVGFYEGRDVAYLEANFKDIELNATTLWEVAIPTDQKHMDLKMAKTASGAAFSGFTGTGVYAVAIMCGSCQVPAPVALSILQPAP